MFTDLRLQFFRSYEQASFEFQSGVNIIVGPNASGKTNLLEALLVLASGSSYRAKDSDLVQFDQDWARLDAVIDASQTRTVKLTRVPEFSKQYELSGKPYQRMTLNHSLPLVLFEPNHLQLLTGSPERRRTYLDDLLEQTAVGFGAVRRQYKRTLAQRNSLLKQTHSSTEQLFPWNVRLSHLAGLIVRQRTILVDDIETRLGALYGDLSKHRAAVSMHYEARWAADSYESSLLSKLEADQELDRMRGFTGAGPHREDFTLSYDGRPASETASRGEARTAVLALKILELQIIEKARNQTPVLLLDDVFSELDGSRRRALTEHLTNYQTFITTTDADIVLHHFTDSCNVVPLKP